MTNQPFRRLRQIALPMALALSLGAAACSGSGGKPQADVVSSAGGEVPSSTAETGGPTDGDPPEATSPDASSSTDPILSTSGIGRGVNGDPATPLRLDVLSAKRRTGDVVEVRFTITNLNEDEGEDGGYSPLNRFGDGQTDYDIGGARLLDLPNDKVYLPLIDSDDHCLCTDLGGGTEFLAGEPFPLYVSFPAPPTDVTTVDFTVPGFEPGNGLEIS